MTWTQGRRRRADIRHWGWRRLTRTSGELSLVLLFLGLGWMLGWIGSLGRWLGGCIGVGGGVRERLLLPCINMAWSTRGRWVRSQSHCIICILHCLSSVQHQDSRQSVQREFRRYQSRVSVLNSPRVSIVYMQLLLLLGHLIWLDGVKHDASRVGSRRRDTVVALGPVVGEGIGQYRPVSVERGRDDRSAPLWWTGRGVTIAEVLIGES